MRRRLRLLVETQIVQDACMGCIGSRLVLSDADRLPRQGRIPSAARMTPGWGGCLASLQHREGRRRQSRMATLLSVTMRWA